MADKTDILLCIYKDARDTVKHFDNILSNYRKIAYGFNAAIIGSYIGSLFNEQLNSSIKTNNLTVSFIAIMFNYLLWSLEKHYHKYLMFAAQVAKNIETDLCLESAIGLSERLYYASTMKGPYIARFLYQIRRFFHFQYYDLIYLLPILLVNTRSYFCVSNVTWLVAGSILLQTYLIVYMLSYDGEVRRKLKPRLKLGGVERFCKKNITGAFWFAKKCIQLHQKRICLFSGKK